MAQPKFAIPAEFQSQLTFRPCPDKRSDDEILASLSKHQPITSEKNIWCFWDKGLARIPSWCQRNIINWVRVNGASGWTVRVLDQLPESENYALKYVSADLLPESFVKREMDGPYTGPHSADFLRGACLFDHGGVFTDVGNVIIRDMDRIGWDKLEDPNSPFQVCIPQMYGTHIANHWTAARKGDPFIKRWHEMFTTLWKGRTNHVGIIETPIFAPLQEAISFDDSRASNFHWDFRVDAKTVMEYITQCLCWQRLCMLEATDSDSFSGVDYWTHKILIFDVLQENWGGEATLGFKDFGKRMFDLMAIRLDADPESEEYKDAYRLTWRLLTESCMQKITHGKGLTNDVHLGVLWDENEGKDCEPGTFAELLRYGQDNFVQTRESIRTVEAPRPTKTIKKGLMEA